MVWSRCKRRMCGFGDDGELEAAEERNGRREGKGKECVHFRAVIMGRPVRNVARFSALTALTSGMEG